MGILELGGECSNSFEVHMLCAPTLWLWLPRSLLARTLLFFPQDAFIVEDALMAFHSLTCAYFDFDGQNSLKFLS